MLSISIKKVTTLVAAALIAAVSFVVVSCQKEISAGGPSITETLPDLTARISSAVSGYVTDENNAAVEGATVQAGGISTVTDKYGYFNIRNAQVVKNAAVVTVTKPGYFNGIKTYIAETGKSAFFRIKMLPKTIQGNFNAATGGTVTLTNGLSISFPANAVKLASGGTYTGQVSVAAQWINPSSSEMIQTMPGDLRGLDAAGYMRVLTSYGMSATELTGASGEALQIDSAAGMKATVTFPIPAAMGSSAPSNIPLWHFNENNGLWIEEGTAVKNGSNYVGEVKHFSWWNCDLPNATVPLTFNVVNVNGDPVGNVYVNIVPTTPNSWSHAGGYTDSSGHVSILVTPETSYTLSVQSDCSMWGSPAYTQNFSVGTTAVDLGNITMTGSSVAIVSGTVECSGAPLGNAYVVMKQGYFTYRYPVNADGTYAFTATLCSGSTAVTLLAENLSTLQGGNPVTFTLTPGNNTVPALAACVNSIDQYINYTVNGTSYAVTYPADTMVHWVNQQAAPVISYIYGGSFRTGTSNTVNFAFNQEAIAAGSTQTLVNFFSSQIPDSTIGLSGTPVVNITEYGNVNEFISGNFTCTVNAGTPPGTPYNVTCQFRVRRTQ